MTVSPIQYPLGVRGFTTRVLEQGSGDEAVVFVHGVGSRADRWRPTLAGLAAEGYRCIAFDLPGHGLAAKPADAPYSVGFFAEMTIGVLDELGIERVTLVGTSLGGHVVATAACQAPERLAKLVMIGSLGLVARPELITPMAASVRRTSREAVEAKLRRVFVDPALVTEALVTEEWRIANSPGAPQALDRIADALPSLDDHLVTEQLRSLHADLLLIWGERDKSVPLEIGHLALQQLPQARLVVLEGVGHGPNFECPEAFNRLLAEFLTGSLADVRLATW